MCLLTVFVISSCFLLDNDAVFVEPEVLEVFKVRTHVSIIVTFIEAETSGEGTREYRERLDAKVGCGLDCINSAASDPITLNVQRSKIYANDLHGPVLDVLRKDGHTATSFWISNQIHIFNATKKIIEKLRTNHLIESIHQERKTNNRKDAIDALSLANTAVADFHFVESKSFAGHTRSLRLVKTRSPTQYNPRNTEADSIFSDGKVGWHIEKIKASELWNLGYNGTKVRVGVIDSGAMATHPSLKDNFLSDYGWLDAISFKNTPYDDYGHGTAVLSVIAGSNGIGVAPGVEWMACRACDADGCLEASLLRCAEFMLCPPDKNGSLENCSERAPQIINNSWNDEKGQEYFVKILQRWIDAGIIPVFSMGNGGPSCESVSSPSDYADAISVGAINRNDQLAGYSARGPGVNGALKPDFCAPGEDIIAVDSTDGSASQLFVFRGTSAAAPQVSGAIAILLQIDPHLTLSKIRQVLQESASFSSLQEVARSCGLALNTTMYPNNDYGYGQLDILRAFEVLKSENII